MGSFGGTYFRKISSKVTGETYTDAHKEVADWTKGLNIKRTITASTYHPEVNRYGVKCGADLDMWESKGWIKKLDPYGWFQVRGKQRLHV